MDMECPYCGSFMSLEEIRTGYETVDFDWVCSNINCKSHIDDCD